MFSFVSVDLSSNKLSGTLMETYQTPSSSLNFTINRLSGELPSTLRVSNASLNVLEGNIFGCPLLSTDEHSSETPCGSSNLEYPYIEWLVVSVSLVAATILFTYAGKRVSIRVQNYISEWWSACRLSSRKELYHTMTTMSYLEATCSMVVVLSVLFVLVVMVSFICLKLEGTGHTYSLYQVQYLYTPTVAYLVGQKPTVLIWLYVTLSGLVVIALCVARRPLEHTAAESSKDKHQRIDSETLEGGVAYQDHIKSIVVRLMVEVTLIAIAIGINVGFVQIVYFRKPSNLNAVNIAFAIIKILVNTTVVPFLSSLVPESSQQSHRVLMAIVVNVISPGLAVLLTSPLCLYYYFQKESISVSYIFDIFYCSPYGQCRSYPSPDVSTITPVWFYSYECSSSFLTSYLPNFIYMYTISGIVSPVMSLLGMILVSTGVTVKFKTCRQRYGFEYLNCVLEQIDDKLVVSSIFLIDNESGTPDSTSAHLADSTSSSAVVEMSALYNQSSISKSVRAR